MKVLECTATNGDTVYVNVDHIAEIVSQGTGCTLYFTTPDGEADQIARKIREPISSVLQVVQVLRMR